MAVEKKIRAEEELLLFANKGLRLLPRGLLSVCLAYQKYNRTSLKLCTFMSFRLNNTHLRSVVSRSTPTNERGNTPTSNFIISLWMWLEESTKNVC